MLSASRMLFQAQRRVFPALLRQPHRAFSQAASFEDPVKAEREWRRFQDETNIKLSKAEWAKLFEKDLLRNLHKEIRDNPLNYKAAATLLKHLNDLHKYNEVIQLVEKYRYDKKRNGIFRKLGLSFGAGKEGVKDILSEYDKARSRLHLPRDKQQSSPILMYAIIGYLVAWWFGYVELPFSSSSSSPKEDSKTGGANGGIVDNLFGKFVDGDGEVNIQTRFDDVLGIDEFKEELQELVDYLKNPQKYTDAGAKIPKGILLVGPPGTGKTLLARALAGESGCTFFYKTGSEFDEVFVGMGARRVRELFKKARKKNPAIIFIDEIDSLAGHRKTTDPNHSRDTINQILAEMDGFKPTDNIIVIGATNMEDALDPAIKRPGRFDKVIHIPYPDVRGREQIFGHYLSKIKTEGNVDAAYLAKQTIRFTGADIQNMVNLAILYAIKQGRTKAKRDDFDYAFDRILMGVGRRNLAMTDKERLMTAYHEGGHALISLLVEGADPLHKVTILPRGGALGFTAHVPEQEISQTRKNIMAHIYVALGGRAAEELIFGSQHVTSGCSSDLKAASKYAYSYVRGVGMHDKFTLISSDHRKTSDEYNYLVDKEVQALLSNSLDHVKNLLVQNRHQLETLALELMKRETMSLSEVKEALHL